MASIQNSTRVAAAAPAAAVRSSTRVVVEARVVRDVAGESVALPDARQLVHLQFRRFAGCPVCSLHLRTFVRRHAALQAAGVREVVVFHSGQAELKPYVSDLPFAVIPDPDKQLYREFGVSSAPRALLDRRVWLSIIRAILYAFALFLLRGKRPPSLRPQGGRLGLPADFLIAPDGRVLASKHGQHADDQWSVDEVLDLARQPPPAPPA